MTPKLLLALPPDCGRRERLAAFMQQAGFNPLCVDHAAAGMKALKPPLQIVKATTMPSWDPSRIRQFRKPTSPFIAALVHAQLPPDQGAWVTEDGSFVFAARLVAQAKVDRVAVIVCHAGVLTPGMVAAFGDTPTFDLSKPGTLITALSSIKLVA